ncbi:MAG TPA: PIN domain-containing protein [Thermoanaerobaculia bacterium]
MFYALQWASHDCILSLQTLCELFHATTRKGKLTFEQAAAHVADWQTLFPVVAATPASLRLAMRAVEQHGLAFWDAMQWAVAKQSGATLLLSETFSTTASWMVSASGILSWRMIPSPAESVAAIVPRLARALGGDRS